MRVFCTGISGSGRIEYLEMLQEYAQKKNEPIRLFDVGEMMLRRARSLGLTIKEEKILDTPPATLDSLRASVFEEILGETTRVEALASLRSRILELVEERKKKLALEKTVIEEIEKEMGAKETCIVASHGCFRWKKALIRAFDPHYLEKLTPDLYVTIIDNALSTKLRLDSREHWKGKLSLKEILMWRDEEVFLTRILARYQEKPHYIITVDQPVETLLNLIVKPEMNKSYLSYPITHMMKHGFGKVKKFANRLRKKSVVFDPYSIRDRELIGALSESKKKNTLKGHFFDFETRRAMDVRLELKDDAVYYETDSLKGTCDLKEIKEAEQDIDDQILQRDYALIDQSDMVVVYYPPEAPLSPGVISEMVYGFSNNKEVNALWLPKEDPSPFFKGISKVHLKEKDLFSHLERG
jgi:adenylate kinase